MNNRFKRNSIIKEITLSLSLAVILAVLVGAVGVAFSASVESQPDRADNLAVTAIDIKSIESVPGWSIGFVPYCKDINIDGKLDEWKNFTPLGDVSAKGVVRKETFSSWDGVKDCSIRFWAFWNEKGLTLAESVLDDKLRYDNIKEQDFRDADHWRLYFDNGREIYMRDLEGGKERTNKARSFDRTDYMFVAIPTSPEKKPLFRYFNWYGYYHQINDEGHLFDIRSVQLNSRINPDGYDMELFFPTALMRGFKAHPNHIFGFAGIWGDTDTKERECEMAWPQPKSALYYTDHSTFGELVLLSKEGAGFTYRVSPNMAHKNASWCFQFCGVVPDLLNSSACEVIIFARNEAGKVVRTWKGNLKLLSKPTWLLLKLDTTAMPAGNYRLEPQLKVAKEVLTASAWNVALEQESEDVVKAKLTYRIKSLSEQAVELKNKIKNLDGKSYEIAYLRSSLTTLELFIKLLPYDLNNNYYQRALKKIKELEDIAKKALMEADNPDRWCSTWRKVPLQMRPDDTSVTIKDGMFLHHGVPIYLIGVMNQADYANPAIAGLGFNSVSFNHSLRVVMKNGLDQPEWTDTYGGSGSKTKFLDRGKVYTSEGLYWSTMIPTLHYIPEWVRKHPELSKGRGHFLPFAIERSITMKLVDAYYKTFLSQLGGMKNIVSLCLLNEPEYEAGSEEALIMYRVWLKKRYKTIEEVNRRWKTNYQKFDKICKNCSSTGGCYDWLIFNRKIMTDFVGNVCKMAKKYDVLHRPVLVKCMSGLWCNAHESYGGIDREAIGDLTDIVGFDGGLNALHLDFVGSLNPGKPLFHSEGTYKAPAQMWESMIHGLDALTLWLWDPPWGSWGRQPDYPLQQPAGLLAKGQTTLDLQRLAPEIQAIANAPHEVAIVYSFASQALDYKNHIGTIKQVHETLQWCGMPVSFISEKQLLKGEVSGLKTIIVPDARFVLNTTVKVLKDFVGAGGQVILIGDESLAQTPYGDVNDINSFLKLPKVVVLKKDSADWTGAKGRLNWFDSQLTMANIDRLVRVVDATGQLIPGIELRSARLGGGQLLYVCSWRKLSDDPTELHLQSADQSGRGRDLMTNQLVEFPICLKSEHPMLIVLEGTKTD